MSSALRKLQVFARSPQGKKLIAQARAFATKPENQAKIKALGSRLTSKDTRR